jgi:hypothetical protein
MRHRVSVIYLVVILGIYIITFGAISRYLTSPYIPFDEVGQFWISKGLNHDSAPFAKANGVIDVIENNKYYNLDPGGFGITLHFWTYVSNYHIWVRLLPFLFFTGIVLSFIYLSYIWLKNIHVALLMGFIPILVPLVFDTAFIVRAYSMESMGTLIGIVGLERLKRKLTYKHLFLWGCIFSFFMTSRYSEIIVVFIVSLYVLYLIFTSGSTLKQKLLSVVIYSAPLIITLNYIYFFALRFHDTTPLGYLPYLSLDKGLLTVPENLIFLCVLGVLTVLFILKKRYPVIKRYEILLFVTIAANILFMVLSFLGRHPWAPLCNRCISMFLLVVLCVSEFGGEILKYFLRKPTIAKYCMVMFLLTGVIYHNRYVLFVRGVAYYTYAYILKTNFEKYHHIYVDRSETPAIRYLFEYGALKSKKNGLYPDKFTFTKFGRQSDVGKSNNETYCKFYEKCPKMNDLLDYDLLITPELFCHGNNDKWKILEGTTYFFIKVKTD